MSDTPVWGASRARYRVTVAREVKGDPESLAAIPHLYTYPRIGTGWATAGGGITISLDQAAEAGDRLFLRYDEPRDSQDHP